MPAGGKGPILVTLLGGAWNSPPDRLLMPQVQAAVKQGPVVRAAHLSLYTGTGGFQNGERNWQLQLSRSTCTPHKRAGPGQPG
eukprot:1504911-Pleurochrysis_carterae.AAC.2